MSSKLYRPLSVIFLLGLTSCVTLQQPNYADNSIELVGEKLGQLNGSYQILPTDSSINTLPLCLMYNTFYNYKNLPKQSDKVTIEVLSESKIRVAIFSNNKIIKERVVNGELRQGYFEFHSSYLSPFWFFINGYTQQKTRIGLLDNGNLIVDTIHETWAFLVIIPFTGHRDAQSNLEFCRKDGN